MALKLEEIRALADRVAASHGLDVVDLEYLGGGGKHRTLRVFIEKNEAERARLKERVARLLARREEAEALEAGPEDAADGPEEPGADDSEVGPHSGVGEDGDPGEDAGPDPDAAPDEDADLDADQAFLDGLPSVSNLELLSGISHGDCEVFSQDFGTVLDVEELVPGTEYLLEVSSPGLDRRLTEASEYRRFAGSLVKLQTFEPVAGSRHWQGRIAEVGEGLIVLDVGGKLERKKAKPKPKPGKDAPAASSRIEVALGNVEKAHLVPEF
jgi:ribosome maturation factor RimP